MVTPEEYLPLSPLRQLELTKLENKTGCSRAEAREAMANRRHIPAFAEEYLKNKDRTDLAEQFPLWSTYLMMTSEDVADF